MLSTWLRTEALHAITRDNLLKISNAILENDQFQSMGSSSLPSPVT